jgi:hypothetical protein
LNIKVGGKNLNSDMAVLNAVRLVHLVYSFILDANEAYITNQGIEVLDKIHGLYFCKFDATTKHRTLILLRIFSSFII